MTKDKYPDRIPFDDWIRSQLSVAKFYGVIMLNGEKYIVDYDNCRTEPKNGEGIENGEVLYYPDLVKESSMEKKNEKTT